METSSKSLHNNKQPAAIDWSKVRRRLEIANAAIEQAWTPKPEEALRILKARAEKLATENAPVGAVGKCIEVVEFILAQEHYAIESRFIRDVCPLEQLTPLPCTPSFVLGIVNLRGEVLSVIDIKKFFDLPEKGLTDLNKVVVLEHGAMCFGVLADAIVGAHHIPVSDIQPSLPTLTGIRADYLLGITSGRTVVLDAERLLADEKIVVREQVTG